MSAPRKGWTRNTKGTQELFDFPPDSNNESTLYGHTCRSMSKLSQTCVCWLGADIRIMQGHPVGGQKAFVVVVLQVVFGHCLGCYCRYSNNHADVIKNSLVPYLVLPSLPNLHI